MYECQLMQKDELKLVGISYSGPVKECFPDESIKLHERFWKRRDEIASATHTDFIFSPYYGNDQFMTYWGCLQVDTLEGVPDGMVGLRLPSQLYAVVEGKKETISDAYKALYRWIRQKHLDREWGASCIELFHVDDRNHPEKVELWIPVKK
ncbi:GyrI-like domain-containing protein [Paenibacillus sp. SC116]|uniref:GyrI-like domain-containing protein n=1 Tax=Paenibacillus sp. SC116 TaxID=2968986 RepID=UPI00215ABF5C|nr:GyrI-like domain-containing protein [Paenibacillus sp. SC116]MCR8843888.1 GyrI-like domain-containing protein [Paenibacillus sp. SC116]